PETYTVDMPLMLVDIVVGYVDSVNVPSIFLVSYPALRDLHSFPTRRSSDLYSAGVWTAAGPVSDVNALLAGVSFIPAANVNSNLYRKSTRLNCSHVEASSAAFSGNEVNDAPVLDAAGSPSLPAINEDDTSSA